MMKHANVRHVARMRQLNSKPSLMLRYLLCFGAIGVFGASGALAVNSPIIEGVKTDTAASKDLPAFTTTLNRVLKNDLWVVANHMQQQALEAESVAANTLPDPRLSLGLANLPTDSFEFAQEPMTQFKIGVSQAIPKGDALKLQHKRLQQMAEQQPIQREQRKAELVVMVGSQWLKHYLAEQSIALINQNRSLFTQLVSIAESRYSSTMGGVRQQDIVRAQLELTQLEDRLLALHQTKEQHRETIQRWLNTQFNDRAIALTESSQEHQTFSEIKGRESVNRSDQASMIESQSLPNLSLINERVISELSDLTEASIFSLFLAHPSIRIIDNQIEVSKTDIDLAKQSYKPDWMVSANYGYRDDALNGQSRADFFSVGVSFDLPLFTSNKQDHQVESKARKSQSIKLTRWLKLRELMAGFKSEYQKFKRLTEREALYNSTLLPQINQQAESALIAYNNDDGDFAEVVRARIAELNAKISILNISVEKQISILTLNYYLADDPRKIFRPSMVQTNHKASVITSGVAQ